MAKKKSIKNSQNDADTYKEDRAFDNPFKSLDKKSFKEAKIDTKAQKVIKPKIQEQVSQQAFENEEDLFLYTMNNVRTIKNTDKYAQTSSSQVNTNLEDSIKKNQKKEEATKMHEKSNSSAMNLAFEDLLPKKLKNKQEANKEKLQHLGENIPKNKVEQKIEYTNDDEFDFYQATKDVKSLDGIKRVAPKEPERLIVQQDQAPLLHDFEEGKLEFSFAENADHVQCNILGLDILTLAKLQERHYNPEAHIDLHKLTVSEAFHALIGFLKNAYYRDMRSVLIVTGKGINSFDNKPLLRTKVCEWLIDEPFKRLTLAFCTAKVEDGGSGALYVLLRKRRKNSPDIPWERIPNDYDLWAHLDK